MSCKYLASQQFRQRLWDADDEMKNVANSNDKINQISCHLSQEKGYIDMALLKKEIINETGCSLYQSSSKTSWAAIHHTHAGHFIRYDFSRQQNCNIKQIKLNKFKIRIDRICHLKRTNAKVKGKQKLIAHISCANSEMLLCWYNEPRKRFDTHKINRLTNSWQGGITSYAEKIDE